MPKWQKLTPKQKKFADKYIELWNATEAAAQTYNVKDRAVAGAIAGENLQKPIIKGYIEAEWDEAKSVIQEIMRDKEAWPKTRLDASKFIYEQVNGKAVQKVEAKVEWTISLTSLFNKATESWT